MSSEHRCCCFTLQQGGLVACFVLLLVYGLASLGVLIDLILSISSHDSTFLVCEAVLFVFLQLQLSAGGFLARTLTTRNVRHLRLWLYWHAVCWQLMCVLSSSAVTAALLISTAKSGPIAGAVVMAAVLALLAYVWTVMLRLYICAKQKGYTADDDKAVVIGA